jgi:glyoxylate/hydroxypyruvate reductase
MAINALFAAPSHMWPQYQAPLTQAFADAGLDVVLTQAHAPADVDYLIFAPGGPVSDFSPYTRTKAVLNLWAGVEGIVSNATLTQPLARMVEDGLTQGMVEYVTAHVLRHHIGMDAHIQAKPGDWQPVMPPLASARLVTVLGLGQLGSACALMLARIGFAVTGWSHTPKDIPGLHCQSGETGLTRALTGAGIVVTLLPLTTKTANLLNAERLALLAPGAFVINPGRGALIDDSALLAALDSGQIGHATLDVFRTEPLPPDHPFWVHPRITVTPHTAAWTRPMSSARVIAENIRRGQSGEPFLHLVDRSKGY